VRIGKVPGKSRRTAVVQSKQPVDNSNKASIMFHAAMENCRTLLINRKKTLLPE
jgi:hypothetical protein